MVTAELEQTVREMIADVLALEIDEVQPPARFFEDLNGESLDLLDFIFRAEHRWQVKLSLRELAQNVSADGVIGPELLSELKRRAPFLNFTPFERNPEQARASELFTVSALTQWVAAAIEEKELRGAQPAV